LGTFETVLQCKDHQIRELVYVVRGAKNNLLSGKAAINLGLTQRVNEVPLPADVFGELGCFKGPPLKLYLKPDAVPYCVNVPRRVSQPLLPKVQQELERMQSLGIIVPVEEPTPYCAPMVVVTKKSGDVRLCVDLKRLNDNLVKQKHWMPTLDELMPKLKDAKVFSKLDASSGFWSVLLDEESSK
jgi:hypothetical protein